MSKAYITSDGVLVLMTKDHGEQSVTLSEFERNHPITLYCDCLRPCPTTTVEYDEAPLLSPPGEDNPAAEFKYGDQ